MLRQLWHIWASDNIKHTLSKRKQQILTGLGLSVERTERRESREEGVWPVRTDQFPTFSLWSEAKKPTKKVTNDSLTSFPWPCWGEPLWVFWPWAELLLGRGVFHLWLQHLSLQPGAVLLGAVGPADRQAVRLSLLLGLASSCTAHSLHRHPSWSNRFASDLKTGNGKAEFQAHVHFHPTVSVCEYKYRRFSS